MTSRLSSTPDHQVALAIDIGSSSVRALLFDDRGNQVPGSETQLPYRQVVTSSGGSESYAIDLRDRLIACIDGVLASDACRSASIAAVGMTSFWHGLLGLTADREPATPVYMWSDKRSGYEAERLSVELDASSVHARTGCRLHSSYWPAKLGWLAQSDPETYGRAQHWVSVTDYLLDQFTGSLVTSVSMASGTGLQNAFTLDWDEALLEYLGIGRKHLPIIVDRTDAYPELKAEFQTRWPALVGVPWYPAIGDGAAANVGSECVVADRIAMTIGTSAAMRVMLESPAGSEPVPVPHRIWRYRLDRNLAVVGGALSNGGNAATWVVEHSEADSIDTLTTAASKLAPDGHGLTILPLFAGERSPSWNEHATGTIHGLRLATSSADLFRATLEATSYRLAAIHDDLATLASSPYEIHANGAAALGSPLWLQIIADTLNHQVDAVDAEMEASARGAAICALQAAGVIDTLLDTARPVATRYRPNQVNHQIYAAARERQAVLEAAIGTMHAKDPI